MTKDDIIHLPQPNLRKKSAKVSSIDSSTLKLVDDMVAASLDWEDNREHEISAALAAIQVDVLKKVIIIRNNFDDKEEREFTALINPEIVKYEGEQVEDFEGCLSVSGSIYGKVKRASKVRVKALDTEGREVRFKAEGFLARVVQHEIDHTKGILFIDHIREKTDAFYILTKEGSLDPLDYTEHIKNNQTLWDDL